MGRDGAIEGGEGAGGDGNGEGEGEGDGEGTGVGTRAGGERAAAGVGEPARGGERGGEREGEGAGGVEQVGRAEVGQEREGRERKDSEGRAGRYVCVVGCARESGAVGARWDVGGRMGADVGVAGLAWIALWRVVASERSGCRSWGVGAEVGGGRRSWGGAQRCVLVSARRYCSLLRGA